MREVAAALLGVSAYQPPQGYGADIDSSLVAKVRAALGGNLASQPTTRIRWYMADLEAAQHAADSGDLSQAAQLWAAMRRDGNVRGLMGTLTSGVVRLPKKFYGKYGVDDLKARNGTRSLYDDMIPPGEVTTFTADGVALGVSIGELVPVPGRDFPVFVRQEPEFLRYVWNEDRWYFNSVAGRIPITPGDGRWVLHTPGGRIRPWMHGLWPALGRAFIDKEHAVFYRANYAAKLANAARIAKPPAGATEEQRQGFVASLLAWATNTVLELPPGWAAELLESNGKGYEVYQAQIDTADRETSLAITGNEVQVDGGSGFINKDLFDTIRSDIIVTVAGDLSFTVNTQILPQFVVQRHGVNAIREMACVDYDATRPGDLAKEAAALQAASTTLQSLREVLADTGLELDVDAYVTKFGIPIRATGNGDGAPVDGGRAREEDDAEAAAIVAQARARMTRGRHEAWLQ